MKTDHNLYVFIYRYIHYLFIFIIYGGHFFQLGRETTHGGNAVLIKHVKYLYKLPSF